MLFIEITYIILSYLSWIWWQKIIKSIVNVTLINHHLTPSPLVTALRPDIFSSKINSLWVKSTSHWRKGPLNHCKNTKSILSRLKATCSTKCSEESQMSRCSSKQHQQQIGVTANSTNSTSREMVGLQNVDYLNSTKTVLFSLKNEKRMPDCCQNSNFVQVTLCSCV